MWARRMAQAPVCLFLRSDTLEVEVTIWLNWHCPPSISSVCHCPVRNSMLIHLPDIVANMPRKGHGWPRMVTINWFWLGVIFD